MTPSKLPRFYTLLLPFLLLLSAFQIASAQELSPTPTRPVNLSTRMFVETGDKVAIAGFIITGRDSSRKHVAIRVLGQSSDPFLGLLSPMLELHGPDGLISTTNPVEAMLAPGNYTAIVRGGASSDTGLALVEVYDAELVPYSGSKLGNISTRAFVQTGDNIVIAGFILYGDGNDRIVVRGIGPSLAALGVPDPLADPTLELRNSSGTKIADNDDWLPDPGIPVALHPEHVLESALAATLPPGQYTALLAGLNNTTGIGVVEVYDLGPP